MSGIIDKLVLLQLAPRSELLDHWEVFFGIAAPKNLSTKLLRRAVIYELQVAEFGGLPHSISKQLKSHIKDGLNGIKTPFKPAPIQLKTGAKLLREWNGRSYEVEVTENGFIWNDKTYKSLSAIAKDITGAHWSGPRFFGLNLTPKQQPASDLQQSALNQQATLAQ